MHKHIIRHLLFFWNSCLTLLLCPLTCRVMCHQPLGGICPLCNLFILWSLWDRSVCSQHRCPTGVVCAKAELHRRSRDGQPRLRGGSGRAGSGGSVSWVWPDPPQLGEPSIQLPPGGGRRPGVPHLPAATRATAGHAVWTHLLCPLPAQLPAGEGLLSAGQDAVAAAGMPQIQHTGEQAVGQAVRVLPFDPSLLPQHATMWPGGTPQTQVIKLTCRHNECFHVWKHLYSLIKLSQHFISLTVQLYSSWNSRSRVSWRD